MAKLFIGIALALMLATAALGFLAKGNIDKLQSSLKGKQGELTKTQGDLQTAKNSQKKSEEERDAANSKAEEATKTLEAKVDDLKKANADLETAKADVAAKGDALAVLQKKYDDKVGTATTPPVEDPRIPPLMAEVQAAKSELAEAKAVLDQTINKGKENEVKLAELEKEKKQRDLGVTRRGLKGSVLAVNAGWNFVVLSVGDRQGVMVNSPLLVVRGNTPVARLRITSVEASQSIADIIPGSVARGVTVQPGDTVIFEGIRAAGDEAKPAAASEAPATPPALPVR